MNMKKEIKQCAENPAYPTKLTMSSVEIAVMTGKRHCDVIRSIRAMEPAWEKISLRKFASSNYKDERGKRQPCYLLDCYECMYIATKFNDEARAKLVLRWAELEEEARRKQAETALIAPTMAEERLIKLIEDQGETLRLLSERLGQIENTDVQHKVNMGSPYDLYTIISYCFINDIQLTRNQRAIFSYLCAAACNNRDIYYKKTDGGNKYPYWVIEQVFTDELMGD